MVLRSMLSKNRQSELFDGSNNNVTELLQPWKYLNFPVLDKQQYEVICSWVNLANRVTLQPFEQQVSLIFPLNLNLDLKFTVVEDLTIHFLCWDLNPLQLNREHKFNHWISSVYSSVSLMMTFKGSLIGIIYPLKARTRVVETKYSIKASDILP